MRLVHLRVRSGNAACAASCKDRGCEFVRDECTLGRESGGASILTYCDRVTNSGAFEARSTMRTKVRAADG